MNNNYTNKVEVCYKDVCAKFYNKNADIIAVVALAIIVIAGVSVAAKAIS